MLIENKMSKLEKLKEKYTEVQKKYGLPSFKELNENLSIERMANSETDLVVLETRRRSEEHTSELQSH